MRVFIFKKRVGERKLFLKCIKFYMLIFEFLLSLLQILFNMSKISRYFQESLEEMKKVTWPTKKETYNYTVLVIVISLAVAAFLGILDYGFNLGLKELIIQ